MTAAAIDYRADRVCIATDSAIYDDDGVIHGYNPKVFGFAAQRCLLFARGMAAITQRVAVNLLMKPTLHCFEDVVDALPGFIATTSAAFYKEHGLEIPEGVNYFEALLCGWSHAEGRMRSAAFISLDGFQAHSEGDDRYGGPIAWPVLPQENMPLDKSSDTVERKLLKVLEAIDAWAVEHAAALGNFRLGGDVQCVTLHEAGISYRVIGTVGTPQAKAKKRKGR